MTDDKRLSLATRCEQATADDELKLLLEAANLVHERGGDKWREFHGFFHAFASFDAAMTLVPEGWHVSFCGQDRHTQRAHAALERNGGDHGKIAPCEDAATLALALCAASLRSLANKETD